MNNLHLRSENDLPALRAWLVDHGTDALTLDTETTGLDVFDPDFLCGVVCLAHADGTSVTMDGRDAGLVRSALRSARSGGRPMWAHNANYDAWVLRKTAHVKMSSLWCSAVASRVVWPGLSGGNPYSLKALRPTTKDAQDALKEHWGARAAELDVAFSVTPPGKRKRKEWLPQAVRHLPADDPVLLAYVIEDSVECARLVDDIKTVVGENPGDREHLLRDLKVDQALRWTGYDGLGIDRAHLAAALADTEREVAVRQEYFGFNPATGNGARLEWVTSRGIRLPPTKNSAKRHAEDPSYELRPSLNKKDRPYAEVPPEHVGNWKYLCESIELASVLDKMHELDMASRHDNLAHTRFLVNQAATGRMSAREPATQNIPPALKRALVAKPGMALVSADLAHVEPSIMAAASADATLMKLCADPSCDIYEETAALVWGETARAKDESGNRTPEAAAMRKKAKVIFLALGYGMGNQAFAQTLGLPPTEEAQDEAGQVRRDALDAYPDLSRWLRETKKRAESGEQITTLDGRRLPSSAEKPYIACNHVIQGTAASVFKRMVLAVDKALSDLPDLNGRSGRIWLPVHDEIIVECPDDDGYIESVARILSDCMTTEVGGVPLFAEPQFLGRRWRKDGAPIHLTEPVPAA